MPDTAIVRGQREVGSGATSAVRASRRGARIRTSAGTYGASRMPRRARAAPPVRAAVSPDRGVRGGLGGVQDGGEGALAVVRGAGLEEVDARQ
ncbi:hypothetical protein [Streptomyces sp. NPDC060031]|uniref:hypothetical protein n=1 Tax=Streptomyces sp. NPDC060031 TaxID=3347043 RepID=UPI00367D9D94